MENYFNLFEKFGNSQKKYTCSVGKDEFLIHVFSKEEIEFLKELDQINSLSKKYSLSEFWVSRYRDDGDFKDYFEEVFIFECKIVKESKNVS